MASIKLTGDTSGEITISAPAVAGTNTLTLPATTGSLMTSTFTGDINFDSDTLVVDSTNNRVGIGTSSPSQKLDVNGTINATAFQGDGSALTGISGGKVLQVVTNHVDTIASYYIDSATPDTTQKLAVLDTSITPTASDSKILVTFSICGEGHWQSVFRLFRGNTEIGRSTQNSGQWSGFKVMDYDGNVDSTPGNHHFVFTDTPNTTSSISYNLRISESVNTNAYFRLNRAYNGASTGQANFEIGTSQVILMEIGA